MSVIQFLENHIGITSVEFVERTGCAEVSIQKWEEENVPIKLPDDYKAFLQISDGLQRKEFEEGEFVFNEGDEGNIFYLVIEG